MNRMNQKIDLSNEMDWDTFLAKSNVSANKTPGVGIPSQIITVTPAKMSDVKIENTSDDEVQFVKSVYPTDVSVSTVGVSGASAVAKRQVVSTSTKKPMKKKGTIQAQKKRDLDAETRNYLIAQDRKVRKQQIKLLEAIQSQERSIAALKITNSRIQTRICDHLKGRHEMKSHLVSVDVAKILQKPRPWQYKDMIERDDNPGLEAAFTDFVDEEETKRVQAGEENVKKSGGQDSKPAARKDPPRRYLSIVNLKSHGNEICAGCNNIMTKCHDVVYGPHAVNEVVCYINQNPEDCDDITVKKIFIDTYNNDLSLDIFRGEAKDIKSDSWLFPPRCMQDNSYSYAIYWYGDNYERIYRDDDVDEL